VDLANPQSLNRYAYVLNNATTFVDPLGLDCTGPDSSGIMRCTVSAPYPDEGGGGGLAGHSPFAPLQDVGNGHQPGAPRITPPPAKPPSIFAKIKSAGCSAIPQGRTFGISGGIGGMGGQPGSLELPPENRTSRTCGR
jgi:hypothetical protein